MSWWHLFEDEFYRSDVFERTHNAPSGHGPLIDKIKRADDFEAELERIRTKWPDWQTWSDMTSKEKLDWIRKGKRAEMDDLKRNLALADYSQKMQALCNERTSMTIQEAQESHELVSWFMGLSMEEKRNLRLFVNPNVRVSDALKEKPANEPDPKDTVLGELTEQEREDFTRRYPNLSKLLEEREASNKPDPITDEMDLKLSRKEPEMSDRQKFIVNIGVAIKKDIQERDLMAVLRGVMMGVAGAYADADPTLADEKKWCRVMELLTQAKWNAEGL